MVRQVFRTVFKQSFRDGLTKKKVVHNLTINLYENQITGFLGLFSINVEAITVEFYFSLV